MAKPQHQSQRRPTAAKPPQPYEQAIDIIAKGFDAQAIAVALAKKHPSVFVQLYQELKTQVAYQAVAAHVFVPTPYPAREVTADWYSEVAGRLSEGNKVQAIKTLREKTGLGLKESMDIVNAALEPTSTNVRVAAHHSHHVQSIRRYL